MDIQNGTVLHWNEEKAFGFILPASGGKKLFFHINDYSHRHKHPIHNLQVQYFISTDPKGRPCAINVAPVRGHRKNGHEIRQKLMALCIFSTFAGVLCFLYSFKYLPLQIVALYGVLSIVTFLMYAKDKHAAESGQWRIPENHLHLFSLMGGWPGAQLAQSFLRHKSKKTSFRITYWLTVCINCGALYWITTPEGNLWLQSISKTIKFD